jgi:hypothetical protein
MVPQHKSQWSRQVSVTCYCHVFSALLVQFFSVCTKTWICSHAPDDSVVHRALTTCGPSVWSCFVSLIWFLEFWGGFQTFGKFLDPSVKICYVGIRCCLLCWIMEVWTHTADCSTEVLPGYSLIAMLQHPYMPAAWHMWGWGSLLGRFWGTYMSASHLCKNMSLYPYITA